MYTKVHSHTYLFLSSQMRTMEDDLCVSVHVFQSSVIYHSFCFLPLLSARAHFVFSFCDGFNSATDRSNNPQEIKNNNNKARKQEKPSATEAPRQV